MKFDSYYLDLEKVNSLGTKGLTGKRGSSWHLHAGTWF